MMLRNDGRHIKEIIKLNGFRYLFLSILHVEANYLLLTSFHHYSYLGNQVMSLKIIMRRLELYCFKVMVLRFR